MLRLAVVGDVFLPRNASPGAFVHSADLLAGADVAFLNLEAVASDLGQVLPGREYPLRMPPGTLRPIVEAGFNLASVAHNHALDFGVQALLDSVRHVADAGLVHAGAGRDLQEASTPGILEANGQRVALLAYATAFLPGYEAGPNKPGIATLRVQTFYDAAAQMLAEHPGWPPTVRTEILPADLERLQADIRSAASSADVVLVSFHWGIPGSAKVLDYQVSLAHAAIDAGAAAVLGHHPHCLQGIEIHRGRPIFYSLGNFVFELPAEYAHLPYDSPYLPRESMLARWNTENGIHSEIELMPMWIDDLGHPHPAVGSKFTHIQSLLDGLCKPFGTQLTPRDGSLKVSTSRHPSGNRTR